MSARDGLTAAAHDRTDTAIDWWVRLQDDEAVVFSAEFQAWLADPANEKEFQEIERSMERLDTFGASAVGADTRRAARSWLEANGSTRLLLRRAAYAAAAAVLIAVGGGGYHLLSRASPASYQTAIGERRAVALADGSHVLLDSNSEVTLRFSGRARNVTLIRGHARFDVAHDKARPFSVFAGTQMVTAVGTSFDVELRGPKVFVTLVKGRVVVRDAPGTAKGHFAVKPVQMVAGQQLVASTGARPTIALADFAVTQAWEAGHLVFHHERLADAAEQVNRYAGRPIVVDPAVASFRLSGVFNTGDTRSFVSAASQLFPIEAVANVDGTITLRKVP